MVSPGPSGSSRLQGRFILGAASHLDAFSRYLRLPSLPDAAVGTTVVTRGGTPTWSSRTTVRAPQYSTSHIGYSRNCLTTFSTQHMYHFNRLTAGPLGPAPVPGCDKPTSRFQTAPSM